MAGIRLAIQPAAKEFREFGPWSQDNREVLKRSFTFRIFMYWAAPHAFGPLAAPNRHNGVRFATHICRTQ